MMNVGNEMNFLKNIHNHPELIILLLMVMIITMLIVPLPTYLIDFLIALNIILALLIFLGSFYIERILSFSSFPSILLITTLFRLSLSISTSRLILLEADAGEIITSFGNFVIGDSLAVGFVIFSIVTIVQFIVITKGSERVAEVAARFSLDGMPGKQMSIDADLRAGIIDAEEAKERRSVLERESQLYGSFDGAMKFIKGDAIANIIVIFVNIIGGLSVGVGKHDMDFSTALSVYTILTVGDGLVSQIPALLIAISAGFIVTRVNGDSDNMGRNIVTQLLNNSFVIMVSAVLALALGLVPGFPLPVFMLLSVSLLMFYYFKFYKSGLGKAVLSMDGETFSGNEIDTSASNDSDREEMSLGIIDNLDTMMTETVPLVLLATQTNCAKLLKLKFCERVRSQFFVDYGIHLPEIIIRESKNSPNNHVVLLANEVRADDFIIFFDLFRVIEFDEDIASSMKLAFEKAEKNKEITYWVKRESADKLKKIGYRVRAPAEELYYVFSSYLAHNIAELFGIQETKTVLDNLESKYPDLIREVLRYLTIQRIAEVIQRLVQERISVRNMRLVMESLAVWGPREKDIIVIVEHVRGALCRYISGKFAVSGEIKALALSRDVEEIFRSGIRQTSSGTYLNLEPSESDMISDIINNGLHSVSLPIREVVMITSVDIRRFVKRYLEPAYPELEVLSYGELTDSVNLNIIKTLG